MPISAIDKIQLKAFIDENFYETGTEMKECTLPDWSDQPEKIISIKDQRLKRWALKLNEIWRFLCREIDPIVKNEADRFSLLYVPNRFVVPGGRFREFYYWDAYWIIKGLIASGMLETSRMMIENFVYMVNQFGFVPNGGRIYYSKRSQPPLLLGMVYEYYEATQDREFIRKILPTLEQEVKFWEENRNVTVKINDRTYNVFQYRTVTNVPRPEMYAADKNLVKQITKESEKRRILRDVASAAESGWDFSSRWFADKLNLHSIETTNVVPVDLNAYICWNYQILGFLYDIVGDNSKSLEYQLKFDDFRNTFQEVFYVKNASGWYDFNLRTGKHNLDFYPSIATPLFTQCYYALDKRQSDDLFDKMEELGVFHFNGGIPTSIQNTSQQWDFPNGWSPLNHMIFEGLRKADSPRMQEKAYWLAQKWVLNNYDVYEQTGHMWEKYNVYDIYPQIGGGGEYDVQAGFGWTNGVILDLLVSYNQRMNFVLMDGKNSSIIQPGPDIITTQNLHDPAKLNHANLTFAFSLYAQILLISLCLFISGNFLY
uniref:Trehalase n=1 Tax=Acrobeloides nanus TaxID=290746 RepID=A0A914CCA9_9BILA